jgi:hypothetical protein
LCAVHWVTGIEAWYSTSTVLTPTRPHAPTRAPKCIANAHYKSDILLQQQRLSACVTAMTCMPTASRWTRFYQLRSTSFTRLDLPRRLGQSLEHDIGFQAMA